MGKYSTWERKKLTRRTCYNHATFLILAWPRGGKLSELVGVINLNKIQVLLLLELVILHVMSFC